MSAIEELYESFGPAVVQHIRSQVELHGDLTLLLQRLNTPYTGGLNSQHQSMRAFLYNFGTSLFLRVATNPLLTRHDIEQMKVQKLIGVRAMRTDRSSSDLGVQDKRNGDTVASPQVSFRAGAAVVSATRSAAAVVEIPAQGLRGFAAPETGSRKWITASSYTGPERRGIERRNTHGDAGRVMFDRRHRGRDRRKPRGC